MKNFKCLLVVVTTFIIYTNPANAQMSVNSVSFPENVYPSVENNSINLSRFIEDMEFTPSAFDDVDPMQERSFGNSFMISIESAPAAIIEHANNLQFKYAMLLDVAVESITSSSLYRFIDDWYGTRYRMGGSTKRGIDCSAFTSCLLLSCYSLSVPRTAREQHAATEPVEKDELTEGDLVFFNTRGGVSHVGVYLSNNHFVHSSSSQGVVISSLDDSYYAKRFIRGGRVIDQEVCINN